MSNMFADAINDAIDPGAKAAPVSRPVKYVSGEAPVRRESPVLPVGLGKVHRDRYRNIGFTVVEHGGVQFGVLPSIIDGVQSDYWSVFYTDEDFVNEFISKNRNFDQRIEAAKAAIDRAYANALVWTESWHLRFRKYA